jgi:hypothetical protein
MSPRTFIGLFIKKSTGPADFTGLRIEKESLMN